MAGWTGLWGVVSATAAFRGFGGAPGLEAALAQILFFVALFAVLVSLALASTRPEARDVRR